MSDKTKFLLDLADECERNGGAYGEGRARGIREAVAECRTALAAAERERDSAKAEVERLRGMLTSIHTLVDFPDLHVGDMRLGLHCGVEDRNLRDRYDGADYGWEDAAERCAEWAKSMSALTPAPPQAKENT